MVKNVWITGDLHGDYSPVAKFYVEHRDELSENRLDNLLIVLGDFGANYFFNARDRAFKERLAKFPLTYFVIRGNHEERPSVMLEKNPMSWSAFESTTVGGTIYFEDDYPYIMYAKDEGGDYCINGKTICVIPGAYSIDKEYRLRNGWSWFPGEQMTKVEKANLLKNLAPHYDYIFSHTCPLSWEPQISDLFLDGIDESKIDKSMESFLDKVISKTTYGEYFFGHFHDDRDLENNAHMLFHKTVKLTK